MATKSVLKNLQVKTRPQCKALVKALESSQGAPAQRVPIKKTVTDASREQIRKIFGEHS